MINWETLKLTTITLPMKSQYSWFIPFLIFIFSIVAGPLSIALSETEEGQKPNAYIEKHGVTIAWVCGLITVLFFYTLQYCLNQNAHYKVTVELNNPNIHTENLIETPILSAIEKQYNIEYSEGDESLYSAIVYFRKPDTKIYKEQGKIYFTTVIFKSFYERYKSPEQFKGDLSTLISHTTDLLNKYPRAYPENKEAMKEFTEKYATDKITMPKFEGVEETQNKEETQ